MSPRDIEGVADILTCLRSCQTGAAPGWGGGRDNTPPPSVLDSPFNSHICYFCLQFSHWATKQSRQFQQALHAFFSLVDKCIMGTKNNMCASRMLFEKSILAPIAFALQPSPVSNLESVDSLHASYQIDNILSLAQL